MQQAQPHVISSHSSVHNYSIVPQPQLPRHCTVMNLLFYTVCRSYVLSVPFSLQFFDPSTSFCFYFPSFTTSPFFEFFLYFCIINKAKDRCMTRISWSVFFARYYRGRSNERGWDGWGIFPAWEKRERHTEFCLEKVEDRREDLDVDEKIILKRIWMKWDGKMYVGSSWLSSER